MQCPHDNIAKLSRLKGGEEIRKVDVQIGRTLGSLPESLSLHRDERFATFRDHVFPGIILANRWRLQKLQGMRQDWSHTYDVSFPAKQPRRRKTASQGAEQSSRASTAQTRLTSRAAAIAPHASSTKRNAATLIARDEFQNIRRKNEIVCLFATYCELYS
jgi:hypothetical protein